MRENELDLELLASTCDDGDCPKLQRDPANGDYLVRGRTGPAPDAPEVDIRMRPDQWETLIARYGNR